MNAPQNQMLDYVIYGKTHIDQIRRLDGVMEREILGGGGPQGAFGARVWSPSVGFLTRTGDVIPEKPLATLHGLDVDLQGWYKFPHLRQPTAGMEYDENQYMRASGNHATSMELLSADIRRLLDEPLAIPAAYQHPHVMHLITEYYDDKIYTDALALRQQGVTFSVEPLIDYRRWTNREQTLAALPLIDVVSPDWPSASGLAGSDDPATVLRFWSEQGPAMVAVRSGARGSYVWDRITNKAWRVPPVLVNVVDPTGAGNAYAGGQIVGWDQTQDALYAGCYGAVSASFAVEVVGIPAMSAALQHESHIRLDVALERARPL